MSAIYGLPYFQAEPDPAFAGRTLLTAGYSVLPGQQQVLHVVNSDLPHVCSALQQRMNAMSLAPEAAATAHSAKAQKVPYFTALANASDATRTIITAAYNSAPHQQQTMNIPNGDLPHLNWVIGSMIAQLGMSVPA